MRQFRAMSKLKKLALKKTEHRTGSSLSEAQVKLLTELVSTAISFHACILPKSPYPLHRYRLDQDDHLFKAFQYIDKDNSGFITSDELRVSHERVYVVWEMKQGMKEVIASRYRLC
ncbi:unnamed protein product [Brassica oleracea]